MDGLNKEEIGRIFSNVEKGVIKNLKILNTNFLINNNILSNYHNNILKFIGNENLNDRDKLRNSFESEEFYKNEANYLFCICLKYLDFPDIYF